MNHRWGSRMLACFAMLLLLGALSVRAQDAAFATHTPTVEYVLLPRDAVDSYTDLTPLREELLAAADDATGEAGAPTVIYVEAPAEPDAIDSDDVIKIGLFVVLALALWFLRQNNVTAATLIPSPLVQEMVRSAATAGVEAARAAAASTPNTLDDELVRELALRVAAFFNPPPATTPDVFPDNPNG